MTIKNFIRTLGHGRTISPRIRVDRRIRPHLVVLALIALLPACSPDVENAGESAASVQVPASNSEVDSRSQDSRPSVVVVVFDTLRADAVSSYGFVEGTTPTLDRLADKGMRYAKAFAPAPWTIASHVSLFTGLRVDQHGIGLQGSFVPPDSLQMIAEDFQEAGFETAGFAENALVSRQFGFEQGFDVFAAKDIVSMRRAANLGQKAPEPFDLVARVRRWNDDRDKTRPFFLFLNLFGPHDPYVPRTVNPWVASGISEAEADFVQSRYSIPESICDGLPTPEHVDVLRGLYLGDVAAADQKFESILQILDEGEGSRPPLVIATSDHGEHFGEHRLMGHQFSVRTPTLHIPLIVAGLPGDPTGVIEEPVELRQVHQSLLCWALDISCPASLWPQADTPKTAKGANDPIISIYSDSVSRLPSWLVEQFHNPPRKDAVDPTRLKCATEDRVFGEMVSMIRYPMKMIWFSETESVLYDLSWDPDERFDQTERQPELAATFRQEIEEFVGSQILGREEQTNPGLTEEGINALKSLGYIE